MMLTAELHDPRNNQQMNEVRIAARIRLKLSSWVDCSMKVVPSKLTDEVQSGGQSLLEFGDARGDR